MGIAIIGLNGCGKSTLNHSLCKATGFYEMDVEDYYFPDQQEGRRWTLEHSRIHQTCHKGYLPYQQPCTKAQVEAALLQDMAAHPQFVLSCVQMNWSSALLNQINLAFWVQAPLELRLHRLQTREEKRFGSRTMPGGDMYEQQQTFRQMAEHRNPADVEESAARLTCPVLILDGTRPVADNIQLMLDAMKKHLGFHA